MTSDSSIFSSTTHPIISPIIHIADNSIMYVQNIGIVNIPKLFIYDVFHVPKVSLNLLSAGQLCELSLDIHFSSRGCFVQDPYKNEILGTWHKVGRLFELKSLSIPIKYVVAIVTSSIWHARLGHPLGCRLGSLI